MQVHEYVGWAKPPDANASGSVPTILSPNSEDGGHGARAPLPTLLSSCYSAAVARGSDSISSLCCPSFGASERGYGRTPSNTIGRPTTLSSVPGRVRSRSAALSCSVCDNSGISLTGLQGTPARSSPAIHSARLRVLRTGFIRSISAWRFAARSRTLRKRGSLAHSGWPSTPAHFTNNRSLPAAMQIGLSEVSNTWYGTSVKLAPPKRCGGFPVWL